ncbi:unnamed protein product [Rotaria magnacalcarata]|uniref:Uncharacterized protein n=4 Tax=Rotaria magnacalcarata TaxID=392030 RepID=A0A8S2J599_9BILA|nr:unnamed protein product [Rotaria magnacalcarata]
MSSTGKYRGRGRARPTPTREIDPPGGLQNYPESDVASCVSETTGISDTPQRVNEAISSDEQARTEKPRRGNPPKVMPGAPRGSGVVGMTSEFSAMRVTSSSGRSSSRSVPYSSMSEAQPQATDKRGTAGDPVNIIANYIKILTKPQWELYQYHIEFIPNVENKRFRREIISQHRSNLKDVAFDGTTIYTFDNFGELREFSCRHPTTSEEVKVVLKKVAENSPDSPIFFHLANLIVRKLLELSGMKLIGRNYYQFDRKIDLDQHKLTLFPGFMTNVNIYEGSLMVNVDLSHKVLNKTTVYQRLQDIFSQYDDVKQAQDTATKELVGQIVLTTYNSKTYKVDEIAWERSPSQTFPMRGGSQCSFIQYYEDKYQLKIIDSGQPLLVSKPSKKDRRAGVHAPFLLIPELCCVTGISDAMRTDFKFMKEIASYTHVDANTRYNRLRRFVADIHQNSDCQNELTKWNITLDTDLVKFEARILDAEHILYYDRSVRYNYNEADWSRDGRTMRHISAKALNHWVVVFPAKEEQISLGLIDALIQVCKPFGMHVEYPHIQQLVNDRPESYLQALQDFSPGKTDLVLCVLSNNRKDRYDALKKFLCLDNPIPSQMVVTRTLKRQNQLMSVATKIGIQINAKLGGEVWGVQIPTKTLMVIGMDSYHDSKRRGASVGAFVASTNPTLTKFYSRVIYQRTAQELMDGLAVCMKDALKEYYQSNNCLPEKIIIYRDGVSDGQLAVVVEHELPQIIETFPKIMSGYEPKLAVIIVKKRGNARFFQQDGRNIQNPQPGTIVDHTVTNAEWYDFYLISQCARQGTVAPTHYNVIWDGTNFKVDHIQRLTYKLCHLYYNWPGTIRVPAVCQYAHKLAFLVGQSLHQDFNDMNLLKIIRWTFNPQKYSFITARSCLGSIGQVRLQTTDVPPKEEPLADVSTKVTPMKKSNLMEFFDTSGSVHESKVIHGRWWYVDELRLKSNEDLHKLWYVLLKERNRLLTMEEEYRYQRELFPNPERIDKVEESMRNIMSVTRERDIAYNLLETGKTGEQTPEIRETSFGLLRYYQPKERILPFYKNRYYQLLWGKRKAGSWTNIFKRRYNEFQEHQAHQETNRIRKIVVDLLQKYPHLRDEEERVMEEYKKRYDFEQFHIPKRLARRPKLRAHQTLWNKDEFIENGVFEDPNSEDYERLQQEKRVRIDRKKT